MSLHRFFFMDVSERTQLRQLQKLEHQNKMQNLQNLAKEKTGNNDQLLIESLAHRINSLEEIAGFQAIILQSLLSKLDEKGVVTKEDVRESLTEIDELDGVKDGKLNINTLLFLLQ